MTTPIKRKAGEMASTTTTTLTSATSSSAKKPKANATITSFFSSPATQEKAKTTVSPTSTAAKIEPVTLDSSTTRTTTAGENSGDLPKCSTALPNSSPSQPDKGAVVSHDNNSCSATTESTKASAPASAPAPSNTGETLTAAAAAPLFNAAFRTNTSHSGAMTSTAKFDKDAWVAGLNAEQKDLLALEIETLDPSWLAHLKDELVSRNFLDLKKFLKNEHLAGHKIFPPAPDVYSWSRHTPLDKVKVVILGQDPYHDDNQAHGLCFSVRPPAVAPPSLANIYKLLKLEYPDFKPPPNRGGLLTPWADRGVLLLNTCLTVRAHQANSHANKGWEKFTQRVIDLVAKQKTKGVVFLAWGKPAQTRVGKIDKKRHHVLQSVHPSPLSAARGFFECAHFSKTNSWLQERYGDQGVIDWNLNVEPQKAGL